jgi:hypothetical protein
MDTSITSTSDIKDVQTLNSISSMKINPSINQKLNREGSAATGRIAKTNIQPDAEMNHHVNYLKYLPVVESLGITINHQLNDECKSLIKLLCRQLKVSAITRLL